MPGSLFSDINYVMASIDNVRKPRGRPAVNATPLTVRVPPDLLAALDAWMRVHDFTSRPEAMREILRREFGVSD